MEVGESFNSQGGDDRSGAIDGLEKEGPGDILSPNIFSKRACA